MRRVSVSLAIAPLTAAIGELMFLRSIGAFGPITTSGDPVWLGALVGVVFFAARAVVMRRTR